MINENESDELHGLLQDAILFYGKEHQIRKLLEEMAELQDAILKNMDNRGVGTDGICTEIADVMIMCMQMSIIFGEDKVAEHIDFKLNRLKERLASFKK